MLLEIITPEKKIYSGKIKLVQLPGTDGSFEIMSNHAAMISSLSAGKAKVVSEQGEEVFLDIKALKIDDIKNSQFFKKFAQKRKIIK